jgi:hypothetical protein
VAQAINRIYLGELSLKGSWYSSAHPTIIDPGLWGQAYQVLNKDGYARSVATNIRSCTDALLSGLLYVPSGEPMYPTYLRKNGKQYRYYVSKSEIRYGAPGKRYIRLPAAEIGQTSHKDRRRFQGAPVTYQLPSPAGGVQPETFVPWTLIKRGLDKRVITPLDAPQQFLSEATQGWKEKAAA